MKKLVIWILAVITVIIAVDVIGGVMFDSFVKRHPMRGDYRATTHLFYDDADSVLVLGSSVGLNSINTAALADSFGVSAFNGASNGQTFTYFLTLLKSVTEKGNLPKIVILGSLPSNYAGSGHGTRYSFLSPYYGQNIADIDTILESGSLLNKIMMRSHLYRLNNSWFRILLYYFVEPGEKGQNGFIAKPIPGLFPQRSTHEFADSINPERMTQLDTFTRICRDNGIKLIMVFPPEYVDKGSPRIADEARYIVERNGGVFWNDTELEPFFSDSTLFYDEQHLNINGARIYTDTVISRLKSLKLL